MMLSLQEGVAPVPSVGGKAASLMKLLSLPGLAGRVPAGFALSVDFFQPWDQQVLRTPAWAALQPLLAAGAAAGAEGAKACDAVKKAARALPLSQQQRAVLDSLRQHVSGWPSGLAAVRSSAPDEDGAGKSFAGIFETVLGVTTETLEAAVRDCFASAFDRRVFAYAEARRPAFAAIVMEMVDASAAGVAFGANPLNSDLDEMVVESSYGLGGSVVDGGVVADRYLWDKVAGKMIERKIGGKATERRLLVGGGTELREVDEARQRAPTLSDQQVGDLCALVAQVEQAFGVPMDVEWACNERCELKLLQARPITTIHPIDTRMLTLPGQRRVLYYDYNLASDATTTSPFTHMDLAMVSDLYMLMCGLDGVKIPDDPAMPMFNGATRQFINFSMVLKFLGPGWFAPRAELLDPYLASLLRSSDLDRSRYRAKRLPREVNCCSILRLMRKMPLSEYGAAKRKLQADPRTARAEYDALWSQCDERWRELEKRGAANGLKKYVSELFAEWLKVLNFMMGAFQVVLPKFKELDLLRRSGKTDLERQDGDALCGGYEGDEVMEANIATYNLARALPSEHWPEGDGDLPALAACIEANLKGEAHDLPEGFLELWRSFMQRFGYDGSDQMFVSSPRYVDSPETLLSRLRHSVGEGVVDPAVSQREKLLRRREVMARRLAEASEGGFCGKASRVRKAEKCNEILDLWMCLRNSPKAHQARMVAMVRTEVLKASRRLVADGRLDSVGDVFHLELSEVDRAMEDPSFDARAATAERKETYQRALAAKSCPILIDSRCRILKPDPVEAEPGTLVGAAVSPGVASGRVRVVGGPTEHLEPGEVLVTVVTDPAWTPLFAPASAIVLQVGGVLQHGAQCARELGKPAVSGIEIGTQLKTGMMVEVDGNTGVVRILDVESPPPAKHPASKDEDILGRQPVAAAAVP